MQDSNTWQFVLISCSWERSASVSDLWPKCGLVFNFLQHRMWFRITV